MSSYSSSNSTYSMQEILSLIEASEKRATDRLIQLKTDMLQQLRDQQQKFIEKLNQVIAASTIKGGRFSGLGAASIAPLGSFIGMGFGTLGGPIGASLGALVGAGIGTGIALLTNVKMTTKSLPSVSIDHPPIPNEEKKEETRNSSGSVHI